MIALSSSLSQRISLNLSLYKTQKNPPSVSPRGFHSRHLQWSCCSGRNQKLLVLPSKAKSSESQEDRKPDDDDDERKAVETVMRLYSAIKNRNVSELSEVIGDECRCLCNFMSCFQPFQGKKQVLDFFDALMRFMGNNLEIVVKPTSTDGMIVGVAWKLQWNKTDVPLGRGFSVHILQSYQGKVFIRNVEMFMEPLLHLEPLRLKIMAYAMNFADTISSYAMKSASKNRKAAYAALIALLFIAAVLFFTKPRFY